MPFENRYPFVTVMIPCRNEEKYISKCITSVINNDYPKEHMELLILDGNSNDQTQKIVKDYAKKYPWIKLLINEKVIKPAALNLAIREGRGDIFIRMDAHAIYNEDYIFLCVENLLSSDADNVGGIRKTGVMDNTLLSRMVAITVSHKFTVGNAYYRSGTKNRRWVDTVFGGCYKAEIFEKIGVFNEKLIRAQDREFNYRLMKNGGKILLVPEIECTYYPRTELFKYLKWIYQGGYWVFYISKFTGSHIISWRNLIPVAFVVYLALLPAILWSLLKISGLYFSLFAIYLILAFYFAVRVTLREKDIRFSLLLPFLFFAVHISYGLGSLFAIVKLLFSKWKRTKG